MFFACFFKVIVVFCLFLKVVVVFCLFFKVIVFSLLLKVKVFYQGYSAGGGEQHAPWLSDAWDGGRRGGRAGNGCQEASEDFEGKFDK